MIAVIDYGAGNVGSVLKAVRYLGSEAHAAESARAIETADKIILPGQGHFGSMMRALDARGLAASLRDVLSRGKPYFGICLGLQALYEGSEEAAGIPGLGILPGRVRRFEGVFKVPHVGWSQLEIKRASKLLDGIPNGSFFYFCHSFYGPASEASPGVTEYGQTFAAAVELGNVQAVQFHPEKSGEEGLRVFGNFLKG